MNKLHNLSILLFLAALFGFAVSDANAQVPSQGLTRQQLEDEFRTCQEAQQHGPSTDAEFTTSLYWRYLGHGPDGNLQLHTARIASRQITRQQLEDEFRTCSEAQQYGPSTNLDFTKSLFWRYLGRQGPDGALQFHVVRLKGNLPVPTPFSPTANLPASGNVSADEQFWNSVKNSQRAQDLQSYLSAFPNGQFAALARFKMNQLAPPPPVQTINPPTTSNPSVDEQFWDSVKNSQRAQDFQSYLNAFPNGQFAALARFKMNQLAPAPPVQTNPGNTSIDQQFWDSVKNSQNSQDFQSYLNNFPNGQFAALARLRIDQLRANSPNINTPPQPRTLTPAQQRGAEILAKAQFGSLSEMRGLQRFFILTEAGDLDNKQIITNELTAAFPQMTAASSEADANFFIIFNVTDSAGAPVTSTSNRLNETHKGTFMAFTAVAGSNGAPQIRILFKTEKIQIFQNGSTFNRAPATNAVREFRDQLKKIGF